MKTTLAYTLSSLAALAIVSLIQGFLEYGVSCDAIEASISGITYYFFSVVGACVLFISFCHIVLGATGKESVKNYAALGCVLGCIVAAVLVLLSDGFQSMASIGLALFLTLLGTIVGSAFGRLKLRDSQ